MTTNLDDPTLLERSAAGDRAAFAAFMDRHAAAVYRFLLSRDADPHDAEDALQECFVSAWRSAGAFRGSDSARGWLFTIARNALRRQHRHRVGEPNRLESLEQLGGQAGWGAQDEFSRRFEAVEELRWAMRQLPKPERDAVSLRDLEGVPGNEAAEALGVSVSALKSRLHRGRLRLMAVLRALEDEHG